MSKLLSLLFLIIALSSCQVVNKQDVEKEKYRNDIASYVKVKYEQNINSDGPEIPGVGRTVRFDDYILSIQNDTPFTIDHVVVEYDYTDEATKKKLVGIAHFYHIASNKTERYPNKIYRIKNPRVVKISTQALDLN